MVASLTRVKDLLDSDTVVFDQHTKTIRTATICDKTAKKISINGTISIAPLHPEEFVGVWQCERNDNGIIQLYNRA